MGLHSLQNHITTGKFSAIYSMLTACSLQNGEYWVLAKLYSKSFASDKKLCCLLIEDLLLFGFSLFPYFSQKSVGCETMETSLVE